MASLPSGTVAFLMTDIEGSTRLAASAREEFPALLDAHFRLLRSAIEAYGGTVVSTEGDSVFAVLPTARAAIAAAVEGQRAMESHDWPPDRAVHVRIGVHVGEAMFGGRDYTGIDVHRAARIMAAAWGGQVIVSEAVESLVGDALEDGVQLRDLGVQSLRDIAESQRLYQVVAPGLRADFPPPRTESAAARTNLPTPLTRFVGRAREIEEVKRLISEARLVTLTGPGGTGKTRLAIEVGRAALDGGVFPDGVFFVALETVRDPELVVPAIAQTLGLIEEPSRPIGDALGAYVSAKRMLLVLDNLEQVIGAAPRISALVGAASGIAVLGSSREPLNVAGEQVYPVPALSLPSEPGKPTATQMAGLESVELFVERARSVRPTFALTDENAPAVAAICRRVDGLPLAIELAAARTNVLTPAQILERLDHRLTLLAGSRRDVTDRQRTLRGAIDWSHELLSDDEKAAFRRFSVFAGGADLDAAIAVLDTESSRDPIDLLAALTERSLVRSTTDSPETRFAMLETIREYAAEQLAASGEEANNRSRHADFYADLAARSLEVLQASDRDHQLDRLDIDMPNFRAALEWLTDRSDYERAAVIAVGLKDFWRTRSHFAESRRLLERVLESSAHLGATAARADVLGVAGELAAWQGDYEHARTLSTAHIATLEALGDRPGLALAWSTVGWGNLTTQPDVAHRAFDQAVDIAREVNDQRALQGALQGNAISLYRLGDSDASRAMALEAYQVGLATSDSYTNTFNVMTVGLIDLRTGQHASAAQRFADALRSSEAAGGQLGMVVALDAISLLALEVNDIVSAARLAVAAERLRREIGGAPTMALVGEQPVLEKVRDLHPAELARAEATAPDFSAQQAIALAYSVTAASSAASGTTTP